VTLALAAALLGIALVDSLNPSALVVTTLLLAGADPFRRSLAYIAGIAVTYYLVGVAVALGASNALSAAVESLQRPAVGFGIEAALGLLLVGFAVRTPRREDAPPRVRGVSLPAAFLTGVTITAVESTTALPYIGALTALVRAEVPLGQTLVVLVAYNLVFVLPPLLLVAVQAVRPGQATVIVNRARGWLQVLDTRPARVLILLLGLLMLTDAGIYFLRGQAAF
jgi:cytochrome c biogenesis protein CcdA